MVVKDEIFIELKQNYNLRKLISDKLKIREVNVYRWAQRKQSKKITDFRVLKIIKSELKFSEKDIFEA